MGVKVSTSPKGPEDGFWVFSTKAPGSTRGSFDILEKVNLKGRGALTARIVGGLGIIPDHFKNGHVFAEALHGETAAIDEVI